MPCSATFGLAVLLLSTVPSPTRADAVVWDGSDERGGPVPAGIYFARLVTGAASVQRTAVVTR